jgi:IS30 family transposase
MGRPRMAREVERRFWLVVRRGLDVTQASAEVGVSLSTGRRWFAQGGGMPQVSLDEPSGRFLGMEERDEVAVRRAEGWSAAAIARLLGRDRSTIGRELARNSVAWADGKPAYRATAAQHKADERARRPKESKLAGNDRLRERVQADLLRRWSPAQIAARLVEDFAEDEQMRISHETLYKALYVQGRGELRRELTACLRTGRAVRKPRRGRGNVRPTRERIKDMPMIADRPAEADARAVPGHWEGDLIIGKNGGSAIGTLVERVTRYTMLLHLPGGRDAVTVADAIAAKIATLPAHLRSSLTWDQGIELARHAQLTIAADLPVYFCDPHSPWQRGTNENTNGLLRQYFPKGTDLSTHDAEHLDAVAAQLNGRPRKTLNWKTPAETMALLLSQPPANKGNHTGVATTP